MEICHFTEKRGSLGTKLLQYHIGPPHFVTGEVHLGLSGVSELLPVERAHPSPCHTPGPAELSVKSSLQPRPPSKLKPRASSCPPPPAPGCLLARNPPVPNLAAGPSPTAMLLPSIPCQLRKQQPCPPGCLGPKPWLHPDSFHTPHPACWLCLKHLSRTFPISQPAPLPPSSPTWSSTTAS